MAKKSYKQRKALFDSIVHIFNTEYGFNDTSLASWQQLCVDVGVAVGGSLTQCRKALKAANVNIVDFVLAKQAGTTIVHHRSANALHTYTHSNGKVFPLNFAKESPFLKAFLIQMR